MVVCKYFLQGTCRFGLSCRFEHSGASNVSPLLRGNPQITTNAPVSWNTQPNPFHSSRKETTSTVKDVFIIMQKDLVEAEKGGMWPLSCYNFWPSIAHGSVPGLDDFSPEELRYSMLQAQVAGNLETFNQQVLQLYQQARARVNALKVASPETMTIIERMTQSPAPPSSQYAFAAGSNVAQDSWPVASAVVQPTSDQASVFRGSATPANPIFGGSQQSAFGSVTGQQSVFGGSTQQSVFGAAAATVPSVFSGMSQTTEQQFAAATPQTAFFAGAAQQQPQAFGVPPTVGQSGGSIFGGSSAVSTSQPPSFTFALPNNFSSNPNNGQTVPTGPFGVQVVPSNNKVMFGGVGQQPNVQSQSSANIFGGFQSVQVPPNNIASSTLYTPLDQLTDEQRKEFDAGNFTVGRIPLVPPPRELC